ncbi:hypothetical protein SDC9_175371 [bioreactor metagenome]|uniref:Uncharacterized protein n=1 Tax=bioreactor metagenome TaxID=1076179 RepID=A0A645GM21_9ZZZZ
MGIINGFCRLTFKLDAHDAAFRVLLGDVFHKFAQNVFFLLQRGFHIVFGDTVDAAEIIGVAFPVRAVRMQIMGILNEGRRLARRRSTAKAVPLQIYIHIVFLRDRQYFVQL